MPLISIITPVFNGAKSLRRCAKSVLRQDMGEFEWIVIDDCSTDDTPRILKKLQDKDGRVNVVRNMINEGASKSRFKGISLAKGEYITFLDSDDALQSEALSTYKNSICQTKADIYVTGSKLVLPLFRTCIPFYSCGNDPNFRQGPVSGTDGCLHMLASDGLTPNLWDKIYKTDLINSFSGECPALTLGEDYILNMRLMVHAHSIHAIESFTYLWSYSGLGQKYYLENWHEYKKAIDMAIGEIPALCNATALDIEFARQAIAFNFAKCLQESCIQRILRGDTFAEITQFIGTQLKHPALKWLDSWNSQPADSLTPEVFLQISQEYLREHRKYYTFTRIINRFLK